MDWFVRPLATMFFGGALGGSSLSINLIIRGTNGSFSPDIHTPVLRMRVFLIYQSHGHRQEQRSGGLVTARVTFKQPGSIPTGNI